MEEECGTYIVDTFTDERYAGNQATVCLIPRELDNAMYQKIAAEFSFTEVAFPVPIDGDFRTATRFLLRWFTESAEVSLCCHATLATSHVLFREMDNESPTVSFVTNSGELVTKKKDHNFVEMDFPQYDIAIVRFVGAPNPTSDYFSETLKEASTGKSVLAFSSVSRRTVVKQATATFDAPSHLNDLIDSFIPSSVKIERVAYASEAKNLIIVIDRQTTKYAHEDAGFIDKNGKPYDYVCRNFAPWTDATKNTASGSVHSALGPFWSAVLKKRDLYVYQSFTNRAAQLNVQLRDFKRLSLFGQCVTVLRGDLLLNQVLSP